MTNTLQETHRKLDGPEMGMQPFGALINQVQILNERDGGLLEAYVPIDLINQEDVAVDQAHVLELAESIRQQSKTHEITGQLSPILLGLLPDHDKFVILDGFHRVPAVKLAGSEIVYATI